MSEDILQDAPLVEEQEIDSSESVLVTPTKSGKFSHLTSEEQSRQKLTGMYKEWFLDYASYVILERAVPYIEDGLKPVQRRILHSMKRMDDGRYNKVANIIGHTMQFHPHGDSSIGGALVQMGQKDLLIDCQGNWGNILTGDSAAAPRYIEARLSKFALDVVFNNKTTNWLLSYDGRNKEPQVLPVKFPLLLAQGVEGIAVGLASKILPHNPSELLAASISYLRGESYELYPDFPTGGMIDVSRYNDGLRGGAVKVRSKIVKIDKKTLAITEIPYGKTTSSIIDSIIKANDKSKIKIRKVDDNTAQNVEILVHLASDVSADKTIDALYAFTDCEVSISPNACVVIAQKPAFIGVKEILAHSVENTKRLLTQELEIRLGELNEDWHVSSLERIFIENRIYHSIEEATSWEQVLEIIDKELNPFKPQLRREVTVDDITRLTEIKIKRISKYNTFKADEHIKSVDKEIAQVKKHLAHIVDYTIAYYEAIAKKYSAGWERKTEIRNFGSIEAAQVAVANAKLYVDRKEGFFGIGAQMKKDEFVCDCSDIDDIIIFSRDGSYKITKASEKAFFKKDIYFIGIFKRNDERTIYNILYRDGKEGPLMMKRCAIKGITRDKEYNITKETPKSEILYMSVNPNGEAEILKVFFRPRPRLKNAIQDLDFSKLLIKGRASQGNLFSRYSISRIVLKEKGVSTLGGHDVWFDEDVLELNREGRGKLLGEFSGDDKTIIFTKKGGYYTAGYDGSTYISGDLLSIDKYVPGKVYTAIYFDVTAGYYYMKRFSGEVSENVQLFVDDSDGSYLVAISEDRYPRAEITFKGAHKTRPAEVVEADSFIGVKGYKAKGKRLTTYTVDEIVFIEPLEEPEIIEEEPIDSIQESSEVNATDGDTVLFDSGDNQTQGELFSFDDL